MSYNYNMKPHLFIIKNQEKDLDEILLVYIEAIELAKSHGKKPGERFDEEFWEVIHKREDSYKLKELKTEEDIKEHLGNNEGEEWKKSK